MTHSVPCPCTSCISIVLCYVVYMYKFTYIYTCIYIIIYYHISLHTHSYIRLYTNIPFVDDAQHALAVHQLVDAPLRPTPNACI